jgi:hypothetical protein
MKTFAYGKLEADTDSWLLASDHVIALDVNLLKSFDGSLEHQTVSVVGRMGMPPGSPGITKLIVDRIVSHEAIAIRAFDFFKSGSGRSQDEYWYRAENELLGI